MNLRDSSSRFSQSISGKKLTSLTEFTVIHNNKSKVFTYDTSKELVSKPAANSGGAFGGKNVILSH